MKDQYLPILKTSAEIVKMRAANLVVARALAAVEKLVKPGVSTGEIDEEVERLILASGAIPLFKNYPSYTDGVPNFPASICASVDEEVVHGIPSKKRILREGQIISVDIGALLNGYCGDAARTFAVGEVNKKTKKLLAVGAECLERGIAAIKVGGKLSHISRAVQNHAEKNGFSVVRAFVGHGIGREMHEPPQVPNFISSNKKELLDTPLVEGMVLAIEPMVNAGGAPVLTKSDGWTVITRDHSLSVHFEHSVAITAQGAEILSVL